MWAAFWFANVQGHESRILPEQGACFAFEIEGWGVGPAGKTAYLKLPQYNVGLAEDVSLKSCCICWNDSKFMMACVIRDCRHGIEEYGEVFALENVLVRSKEEVFKLLAGQS